MAKTLFTLLNTTAEFHLNGPDGEPLFADDENTQPVMVRVQSGNIPTIKAKAQDASAYIHMAGKADKAEELIKHLKSAEKAAEEIAGLALVGWSHDEVFGGPYTPDYAKELTKRADMDFLRTQINTFVGNQSNFFRAKPSLVASNT